MTERIMYRAMPMGRPTTADPEARTVDVIVATEQPVRVWDQDYGVVDEILIMGGAVIPESRQVPLLDSHQRGDTSTVLGSVRGLRVDGAHVVGTAHFAARAADPWALVSDGHITDVSAGYTVDPSRSVFLREGEALEIGGTIYRGPVLIREAWQLKEVSLVPIGADDRAKARAEADISPKRKGKAMKDELRRYLERHGLPEGATDDEALAHLERMTASGKNDDDDQAAMERIRAAAAAEERERCISIRAICDRHGLSDQAEGMIADGIDVDQARAAVLDALAERSALPTFRAETGADERDKFRAAAVDAVLVRSGHAPSERAAGTDDLTGFSLRELAREALRVAGRSTRGDVREMIGRALMDSDLPTILGNIAHKSLLMGWETAEETWSIWCATGSVSDFKTHTIARTGELDSLDEIPAGVPYLPGSVAEGKETYSIATYGKIHAISRQAIINDDLGVLTDIPMRHGSAAARKVGDIAWAVLTANAAMGDGIALFHSSHSNLATSAGAPGVATIGAAVKAMKLQKDEANKKYLNIQPRYFMAPVALESASEIFFQTLQYSDNSTAATDSTFASTRTNIYGGQVFERIYEPRLDAASATAWYLAGMRGKTVTVYFLNGQQAPYMESRPGWSVDGVEYKVRIDAGAKALDWRGLFKNAGQ